MTLAVRVSRGADVGVRQKQPNESYWGRQALILGGASGDQKRIYVRFSSLAQQIRGRVVMSATLSGRVKSGGNHTVEIAELTEAFNQRTSWTKQPAIRSAGQVSQAVTTTDGQRWSIPVTALVQRVASGTTHFGFRLSTPATNDRQYWAFEADNSWWLDIELAEDSDAPVSLSPDGDVVGLPKPTLVWAVDEGDPDGPADGTDAQSAYQVQISTGGSSATIVYDSGWVTSVENQHDMADFAYSLTAGALTYWRVRVRDGSPETDEDYSDWAEVTYVAYPSVAITSPTDTIYDPSPVAQATVGAAFVNYRWLVYWSDGTLRYDSGRVAQTTSPITHTIPQQYNGVRVFPTIGDTYRLVLRVEDRSDRVETPGDRGFVEVERTVTYGSGSGPAPTLLEVEQADSAMPKVRLRWALSPTPDAFTVQRDDEIISVDLADATQRLGVFTWDDVTAKPGFRSYRVRAVTNGTQGKPSNALTLEAGVTGTWLVRDKANGGEQVRFYGGPPALEANNSVADYDGLMGDQTLRITYKRRWPKGSWSPFLHNQQGDDVLDAALAVMAALEQDPTEIVTLVWAEKAIRARLVDLLTTPGDSDGSGEWRKGTRLHRVSCQVRQVGEV